MKKIQLGGYRKNCIRTGEAIVDSLTYKQLSKYKWSLNKDGYAYRNSQKNKHGKRKKILMHNQILRPPKGYEVDHINGNPLDNRRENLRICTHEENCWNQTATRTGTSKYKGVYFDKARGKWVGRIKKGQKTMFLGRTETEKEAAMLYNEMAKELFGKFAHLNKV